MGHSAPLVIPDSQHILKCHIIHAWLSRQMENPSAVELSADPKTDDHICFNKTPRFIPSNQLKGFSHHWSFLYGSQTGDWQAVICSYVLQLDSVPSVRYQGTPRRFQWGFGQKVLQNSLQESTGRKLRRMKEKIFQDQQLDDLGSPADVDWKQESSGFMVQKEGWAPSLTLQKERPGCFPNLFLLRIMNPSYELCLHGFLSFKRTR